MSEINIEQIMEEIRQEIKEKGYKETDLSFSDIQIQRQTTANSGGDIIADLAYMNANWCHDMYLTPSIKGGTFARFIKKVIRKMTRFLFVPALEQQTNFNSCTVKVMNYVLNEELEKSKQQIAELEKRIAILESKMKL